MKSKIITYLILALILTGCAKGTDVTSCTEKSNIYGFFGGLWHGFISIFDLIGMIFSDNIVVYAPNNNGGWYAFGFCLGSGILGFSASKAKK